MSLCAWGLGRRWLGEEERRGAGKTRTVVSSSCSGIHVRALWAGEGGQRVRERHGSADEMLQPFKQRKVDDWDQPVVLCIPTYPDTDVLLHSGIPQAPCGHFPVS